MRRTWVKFYCDQWLRGSIRKESIEVRAIFADLLAMAGDNAFGEDGMIQLADGVGFTDKLISGILNVAIKTWFIAKQRLTNHPNPDENRIEIVSLSQGFSIRILNWRKYQSEYNRQKPYRNGKKEERFPKPPKEENNEDINIEGDIEEKVTKVTKKVTKEKELPPIPKHASFQTVGVLEKILQSIRYHEEMLNDKERMENAGYKEDYVKKTLKERKEEYLKLVNQYE